VACEIPLGEYLDGELAADARRLLEVHLTDCAECRRRVDLERAFKEIYTTPLRPEEAPPDVRRRMMQWNLESYRADQSPNQVTPPEFVAAEHLDRLTMPVLATWGTLDVTSTLRSGEWLVANLPGIRSRVFEGVAHMVNLERPAEFNQMLREFLDESERAAR